MHLYNAADCFAFPSLYEGFGLPLLEAMACGRAVVCSDRSSIPEVADDAGLLFNPEDESAIAHAMQSVLVDPDLRTRMERAGLSRASQFTWRNAAEGTLEVYREVAGLPARTHATVEV